MKQLEFLMYFFSFMPKSNKLRIIVTIRKKGFSSFRDDEIKLRII